MLASASNSLVQVFAAVHKDPESSYVIKKIMMKKEPITLLLEGCAYSINIEMVDALLASRNLPEDKLFVIDICDDTVSGLKAYIGERYPYKSYAVIRADMNHLPFPDNRFDLVIHNFTVNFNHTKRNDEKTIREIKRVMKSLRSGCIFSVGTRSASVKQTDISLPSGRAVFAHDSTYYRHLFRESGFSIHRFEEKTLTNGLGYSRFMLTIL